MEKQVLEIALQAVHSACELCEQIRRELVTEDTVAKNDRSPVTVADYGSQAVIIGSLLKRLPGSRVVAEEDAGLLRANDELRGRVLSAVSRIMDATEDEVMGWIDEGQKDVDFNGDFWVLDPIDGTKGFLRGDQYAVALARVEHGRVALGVLGCPRLSSGVGGEPGVLAYAVEGEGAWIRSLAGGQPGSMRVDSISSARDARFCESLESGHGSQDVHERIASHMGITAPPLRMDSQAKYVAVARGDVTLYLRLARGGDYREKIWDHAAGTILVLEAGGRVTDFSAGDLDFSQGRRLEKHVGILASNGKIHDEALKAVEAANAQGRTAFCQ